VLFVVTAFCSSYCRFCIRKRNWRVSDAASTRAEIDQAIAWLREHEEVRDVLISGGDPLTLPIERLDYILTKIRSVPHIEFVRLGISKQLVPMGQQHYKRREALASKRDLADMARGLKDSEE
jgi:lysine 2,3-aminomutase